MQELWATATVHRHLIRFKLNNKKHITLMVGEHGAFGSIWVVSPYFQDDDYDDDDVNNQEYDGQDDESQDDNQQTDLDNDGDNFVHPKFSTHDQCERQDEEDNFDPRVQTPSHVETTDDEDNDEEIQGVNVEGDKLDKEETNEEDEGDELYWDVTSSSVSFGLVSNMLNPSPYTGIDFIFNLNTEPTSLIDVLVTTIAEPPLLSATTLPPPPTPLITHLQQTPVPTPATTRDEAQAENEDFINKIDDNIKKIIKDQVKEQVKAQVSKILPKIEKIINEQLEAEVLTRSSNESKTSHTVAANLFELELKKILIDKIESNKSIHRSIEQKNLYKALVEAYKSDKLILDTYEDTVTFKRRRDDEDKDEEPFVGSNRGSKKRRARKELESTTKPPFLDRDWNKTLPDAHGPVQLWLSSLAQMEDPPGLTFELMKGSCKILVELEYFLKEVYKETTDQLDWNNPKGQQYPHDLRQPLPLIPNSRGRQVIPFDHFINNDLAIIAVIKLQIVEWYNYKHLDWITVCRDDDKLYTFKEERLAFNVSPRMFTRSSVIQRLVEDLQLGVKSYQKKFNLTKPDTYRSDLKRREAYTAYSNFRGFIYQNKDKKNILMRIDELHKFSDGTLNDVQTALDDHIKGIRMMYLPQTIWRQSDRDKARAMIQATDKQLKTRRIMRSLDKFVGGRPYEGDFRLQQRII
nr:hypothetical protein [Tanacetum cinerariifolium]